MEAWRHARSITVAHQLKSSARSVGAWDLAGLCAEFEALDDETGLEALHAVHVRFVSEIAAVETAFAHLTMGREDAGVP